MSAQQGPTPTIMGAPVLSTTQGAQVTNPTLPGMIGTTMTAVTGGMAPTVVTDIKKTFESSADELLQRIKTFETIIKNDIPDIRERFKKFERSYYWLVIGLGVVLLLVVAILVMNIISMYMLAKK